MTLPVEEMRDARATEPRGSDGSKSLLGWTTMEQICLVAYSDSFQLRARLLDYVELVQEITRKLEVPLTDYTYHTEENLEGDAELHRFDAESLGRLSEGAARESIRDLIFWSDPGPEQHTSYWDFYAEMVDASLVYGCKYVYVQFPAERIMHLDSAAKLTFMGKVLSSVARLGQLEYALVTVMNYERLPWLYFRGLAVPGLSSDEMSNLFMWRRQIAERKMRLRGVYWGNLLSEAHLSRLAERERFIARLSDLVGAQGLATINRGGLFFMLPSPSMISNPIKVQLEALLRQHDLLMQPND